MTGLTAQQIRKLLMMYGAESLPESAVERIQAYLELFELWSRRVNLTTVREPAQVVQRHFGEGFALANALPNGSKLLDLGSGAGFPGIPIALSRPELEVTLAEGQTKKAAFLREVADRMELKVNIWAARAENLVGKRDFDIVVLRAVDDMRKSLDLGVRLLKRQGSLAFFVGAEQEVYLPAVKWKEVQKLAIPGLAGGAMLARLE